MHVFQEILVMNTPQRKYLVLHHVCGAFHRPALFPMCFLSFHHGTPHFFHTDMVLSALSLDVELLSYSSSIYSLGTPKLTKSI